MRTKKTSSTSQVGSDKDVSCQWILPISISVSLSLFCSRTHATTPCFVHWLVTLYFIYDFYIWTSLLPPKWSSDLKYGPCPPACNFHSRVSGLVHMHSCVRSLFAKRVCGCARMPLSTDQSWKTKTTRWSRSTTKHCLFFSSLIIPFLLNHLSIYLSIFLLFFFHTLSSEEKLYFFFSRGHATQHLHMSLGWSVPPKYLKIESSFCIITPPQPFLTVLPCIWPCFLSEQ